MRWNKERLDKIETIVVEMTYSQAVMYMVFEWEMELRLAQMWLSFMSFKHPQSRLAVHREASLRESERWGR
jgi:hypothetical protein